MTEQKRIRTSDVISSSENTNNKETRTQPPTLLTLCTDFVARNILLVDTFYGLPDIIGEKIFKATEHHQKFHIHDKESFMALQLFTCVYEDYVLLSLNCSGQHLGINYCLEHLQLFQHLQKLDLSDCGLGDNHEYLACIAEMERLIELSLRNNSLSDKGIQKLTTPFRVLNKGPGKLTDMDISENEDISSRAITYLNPFTDLNRIDVTGTNVKAGDKLLKSWKFQPMKASFLCDIQTSGWATDIINDWMKTACCEAKTQKMKKSKLSGFYSKSTSSQRTETKDKQKMKVDGRFRLLLIRKSENISDKTIKTCNLQNIDFNKENFESQNCSSGKDRKSKCESQLDEEDLLKYYTTSQKPQDSDKSTLWESMHSESW